MALVRCYRTVAVGSLNECERMKPLRIRLQEARQQTGPPWEVLERDYLLPWILGGIKRPPLLGKLL